MQLVVFIRSTYVVPVPQPIAEHNAGEQLSFVRTGEISILGTWSRLPEYIVQVCRSKLMNTDAGSFSERAHRRTDIVRAHKVKVVVLVLKQV